MRVIVDPEWGPPPIDRNGVSTRVFTHRTEAGELTITLQRQGPWNDRGPLIYTDATLVPTVCGLDGCWSDRVKLPIVVLTEGSGPDAAPPRIEP